MCGALNYGADGLICCAENRIRALSSAATFVAGLRKNDSKPWDLHVAFGLRI